MVGEQQVTAIGSKGFQRLDGSSAGKASGQFVPAFANTDAVAHHPAGRLTLDVEVVDGGGSENHALACIHIGAFEPVGGGTLVGRACGIVVGEEHG